MHIHFGQTVFLRHFDDGIQMGDVAVNAAVTHQTHEVKCAAVCLAVFHRTLHGFVVKEIAVRDGLGDSGQFLVDDAAGTHIGVTDFAVAHLTVRQTYRHAGCADGGVGILGKEFVKVGFGGGDNGVAIGILNAVAVHDTKNKGFFHRKVLSKKCP